MTGSDRPGWVCTGCGKHVTGTIPVDVCADCGGEWIEATPDRLACEGCGSDDASRVLNSEYNRLCGQCVKIDNSVPARVLGEFAYQLEGRGHENIADELSIIIEECKGLSDEDDEPEIVTDGGVDQPGTERSRSQPRCPECGQFCGQTVVTSTPFGPSWGPCCLSCGINVPDCTFEDGTVSGCKTTATHEGAEEPNKRDRLWCEEHAPDGSEPLPYVEDKYVGTQRVAADGGPEQAGTEQTRVGHVYGDSGEIDVYVARGSGKRSMGELPIGKRGWLGNPYTVASYGREGCIEKFREGFEERLAEDEEFREAVRDLAGQTLGCFCQRLDDDEPACHGEVIAEHADRLASIRADGGSERECPDCESPLAVLYERPEYDPPMVTGWCEGDCTGAKAVPAEDDGLRADGSGEPGTEREMEDLEPPCPECESGRLVYYRSMAGWLCSFVECSNRVFRESEIRSFVDDGLRADGAGEPEIEVERLDHMWHSELLPGVRITGAYEFKARLCRGSRDFKDQREVRISGPGWSTKIRPDKIEGAIAALEALKEAVASDELRSPSCIYCGEEVEGAEDARDHYHDEHSDRVPDGEFDRLWYEADPNETIQQWLRDENRSLSTVSDRTEADSQ